MNPEFRIALINLNIILSDEPRVQDSSDQSKHKSFQINPEFRISLAHIKITAFQIHPNDMFISNKLILIFSPSLSGAPCHFYFWSKQSVSFILVHPVRFITILIVLFLVHPVKVFFQVHPVRILFTSSSVYSERGSLSTADPNSLVLERVTSFLLFLRFLTNNNNRNFSIAS